ncbi:MAG: hypothetical protein KAT40_07290 [Bacteroidales bacterium]|nr:hypothetical protein [Bacteroidales bacterium]
MEEKNENMAEAPTADASEQKPQQEGRPTFLTVLCILTFIGSGLSALFLLIGLVAAGAISETLSSIPGMEDIGGFGTGYFLVTLVLALASLYGAIMMWKLKKIGFYLYSGANVIVIFVPMVIAAGKFSVFGLVITALFIFLYALNLKHLK